MFVALEHCKLPEAIEPFYIERQKIDGNSIREITEINEVPFPDHRKG